MLAETLRVYEHSYITVAIVFIKKSIVMYVVCLPLPSSAELPFQ